MSEQQRVMLHVGTPKSGTTFLQRTLWHHHDGLRDAGFLVPGETHVALFEGAIEVRDNYEFWGRRREDLEGTWAQLCAEARAFAGTSIMSHELLAAAEPEQVRRALAELEGLEVHLVVSVRDLGRQVLSEWQERVKNGSTLTFAQFHRRLSRQVRDRDLTDLFWRQQNVLDILERWGGTLPPDRQHVVVAPRSGADPGELWHRFGAACGFDPEAFPPPPQEGATNQTLGAVQVALLRRVNEALDGRIPQPAYARVVKRRFAQRLLAAQRSPRAACPEKLLADLRALSEDLVEELGRSGVRVHGVLDELVPDDSAAEGVRLDEIDPREEARAAAAVIAELLVERAEAGRRARRPQQEQTGPRRVQAALRRRGRAGLSRLRRSHGKH